jgi:hypothetical protein
LPTLCKALYRKQTHKSVKSLNSTILLLKFHYISLKTNLYFPWNSNLFPFKFNYIFPTTTLKPSNSTTRPLNRVTTAPNYTKHSDE